MTTITMQALATGLPAIVTKHSGFPDQVKEGKNGYLVDEGDYEALAERILYYMDHLEIWASFGKFGREHTYNMYDSKVLIDKQVDLYNQIMGENN